MYRDVVRSALDAVAEMDRDDPLRAIAFQEVLRASLASQRPLGTVPHVQPQSGAVAPSDDPTGRIASRLGLDVATVQRVFDFAGGTPTLIIQAARLPASKAGATQQIALLRCAAQQAGIGEAETSADIIRQACDEFGRLDEPNFAATLKGLGSLLIAGGSARSRTYRLTRPGYDRVRSLVETFASGS